MTGTPRKKLIVKDYHFTAHSQPPSNADATVFSGKLWPLGANDPESRQITLYTRIRDRVVKAASNQWRGLRAGQLRPLPGCYHRLPNGNSFIFIHINKTGGTSVARGLGISYKTHLTVKEASLRIPLSLWDSAFKFTVVRNPWDKVVSHYEFRVRTNQTGLAKGDINFQEWVRLAYGERRRPWYDNPKMFQAQVDWLTGFDGRQKIDFVGRFEDLETAFLTVSGRLQIDAQLPHLNRSPRPDYRQYYDPETREIIRARFRSDCELFGYEFDASVPPDGARLPNP